jgi:hypothetical protein
VTRVIQNSSKPAKSPCVICVTLPQIPRLQHFKQSYSLHQTIFHFPATSDPNHFISLIIYFSLALSLSHFLPPGTSSPFIPLSPLWGINCRWLSLSHSRRGSHSYLSFNLSPSRDFPWLGIPLSRLITLTSVVMSKQPSAAQLWPLPFGDPSLSPVTSHWPPFNLTPKTDMCTLQSYKRTLDTLFISLMIGFSCAEVSLKFY